MFFLNIYLYFMSSVKESNGPTDNYAAIAQVDQLRQEPESLRKWREEQKTRLEALGEISSSGSRSYDALLTLQLCLIYLQHICTHIAIVLDNYILPLEINFCVAI